MKEDQGFLSRGGLNLRTRVKEQACGENKGSWITTQKKKTVNDKRDKKQIQALTLESVHLTRCKYMSHNQNRRSSHTWSPSPQSILSLRSVWWKLKLCLFHVHSKTLPVLSLSSSRAGAGLVSVWVCEGHRLLPAISEPEGISLDSNSSCLPGEAPALIW